ncbi:OpgC domain-containing protein [Caulobacter sp.]|uniref:OpgC domain-containing protein n=1 Tax=Caulobacter sp. TaxID=78 RepID=UPI0031DED0D6
MHTRLPLIDVVRGYCLVNIFVNHIASGQVRNFSPSNMGFSDSADLFVFLAGMSTFLAYGRMDDRSALRTLLVRTVKLYGWTLLLALGTLAVLTGLAAAVGVETLKAAALLRELTAAPWPDAAWHLLTLQQSTGYSMVLRLYVGLMLLAPLFLALAARRWWWALAAAAPIWLAAGQLRLVEHDSLTGTVLMLNALPWSLVFACGVALAAGMTQGIRLPRSRALGGLALAVLLGGFAVLQIAPHWPPAEAWFADRQSDFWLGVSKILMSPLRILHLLALVYLVTAFADAPLIRLLHQAGPTSPLAVLGRRSLPVFVTGAVLAVTADEILALARQTLSLAAPAALAIELSLIAVGVAIQWFVATHPQARSRAAWPATPQNSLTNAPAT